MDSANRLTCFSINKTALHVCQHSCAGLPLSRMAESAKRFCRFSGNVISNVDVRNLLHLYQFRPQRHERMNHFPGFFATALFAAVAILLLASSTSFARQESKLPTWPESSHVTVDQAVEQADYVAEEFVGTVTGLHELGNELPPPLDSSTKEFARNLQDQAAGLFGAEKSPDGWMSDLKRSFAGTNFAKVLSSLAIVLGAYFGFVWLTRKFNRSSSLGLPREVVEVLGHTSFGPRKNLQLVRLGSKLLLLMNSAEGTQTIGEITEPNEVEYLASLCGTKKSVRQRTSLQKAVPGPTQIPAAPTPTNEPQTDLKQILRQLHQVAQQQNGNSIFEA